MSFPNCVGNMEQKRKLRVSILVLVDVLPEHPSLLIRITQYLVSILVLVDVLPELSSVCYIGGVEGKFQSLF